MDDKVRKLVTELFLAYERRSPSGMQALISGGFRGRDRLGFGNGPRPMLLSVQGDFNNLRDLDFDVDVHPPEYSADFRQARVDVRFSRRCRFAVGGQEWLVRGERATLTVDLAGGHLRLAATEGSPVFGLTNPMGVLIVDRGTIDGVPVAGTLAVLNGRPGRGGQDLFTFGNPRRFGPAAPAPVAGQPDLSVAAADMALVPSPPRVSLGTFLVRVTVRNVGTAGAGPFQVTLFTPGHPPSTQGVPGLAAGASVDLVATFQTAIPAGTASLVRATADPANGIAESNESNNVAVVTYVSVP